MRNGVLEEVGRQVSRFELLSKGKFRALSELPRSHEIHLHEHVLSASKSCNSQCTLIEVLNSHVKVARDKGGGLRMAPSGMVRLVAGMGISTSTRRRNISVRGCIYVDMGVFTPLSCAIDFWFVVTTGALDW